MEINRLRTFLRRHHRVALDTSIFIYHVEANARYVDLTQAIFSWLESHTVSAVTSTVTLMELLVQPYRDSDEERINNFLTLFPTFPNLSWVAPDLEIASIAAQIRARHRLQTPDALQAATAIHGNATLLITNDPIFERLENLEVLILDRFI